MIYMHVHLPRSPTQLEICNCACKLACFLEHKLVCAFSFDLLLFAAFVPPSPHTFTTRGLSRVCSRSVHLHRSSTV